MDVLIDDVLSLARIERQDIDSKPVNLRHVIDDAWATAATDSLSLSIDDEMKAVVGSHSLLQQTFENLLRNTVEHADTDATGRVGLLDDETGFYFEDDEPGVQSGDAKKAFQAEFSTGDEGTGFGLSIVKEIVKAHDWPITLTESAKGGERFEIDGVQFV